jgi:hypothetical protein
VSDQANDQKADNIIHVDFSRRARGAVTQAPENPQEPANDPGTLLAGAAPPPADMAVATVSTLGGSFRDEALFAAIPCGDGYNMLQFAGHVRADDLGTAQPVGRMSMGESALHEYFEPLGQQCETGLGKHFARMALMSGNPGQPAELYTLRVRAVHVVEDGGLYEFGPGTLGHYRTGDMVVEYAGGSVAYGPVRDIAARLSALDADAQVSLAAAQRDPRNRPDPHFDFTN